MKIDQDKIDATVLALLHYSLFSERTSWKGYDFEIMNRLHEKGYIDNPINKSKSVWLTDKGLKESKEFFEKFFTLP